MKRVAVFLAVGALALVGCEGEPATGTGAEVVTEAPDVELEETDPADAAAGAPGPVGQGALGTRDNPVALGTEVQVADWVVTVTSVEPDAWNEIQEANQFNDPPASGNQYVVWSVDMTYTGSDSGDPFWDLQWKFVGSGGNTFDSCFAVLPGDDMMEQGETFPGASVSGDICAEVASDQFDGGTILVEPLFGSGRTFFAVDGS